MKKMLFFLFAASLSLSSCKLLGIGRSKKEGCPTAAVGAENMVPENKGAKVPKKMPKYTKGKQLIYQ